MRLGMIPSLKEHGHTIINRIVELGYSKTWIYAKLARDLNYPGAWKQHFSQMNTIRECENAIHKLKLMEEYCKRRNETRDAHYTKSLPLIREVGKRNIERIEKSFSFRARKWVNKLSTLFNFTYL